VNLDWRRLKAVVLQSDDWGLCAWVPDEQAHRVLADAPAFRSAAGRIYGRSTLESASDVSSLAAILAETRGEDGIPAVWQANTVMSAPDYARLTPPLFDCDRLPVTTFPDAPSRWRRPGLGAAVGEAIDVGVWWPELHGLVHLPQRAWLDALRRGVADARRAHEQQTAVCETVEASGEFDPREPAALREQSLARAVEHFHERFGRAPTSLCPPDYRWDDRLEADAERLGVTIVQGKPEQHGRPLPRLRHWAYRWRWPDRRGRRFYPPPRIAFEPRGERRAAAPLGVDGAHAAARAAWGRGQPAIISSHRVNYAHLDGAWSEAGRAGLRELLRRLAGDGAVFVTDAEVRGLVERGWSARALGERGVLVRRYGPGRERVRIAAPEGVTRAAVRAARTAGDVRVAVERGEVRAELGAGEIELAWERA
jgi:hypothetical protein